MFNNVDELLTIKEALEIAANDYRKKANEFDKPGTVHLVDRYRGRAYSCERLIAQLSRAGIG